jgi:hypothetical protein
MSVAAILVDGQAATDATMLSSGAVVDILPPFAGGALGAVRPTES